MSSEPAPAVEERGRHPLLGTTLRGTYRMLRVLDRGGMGLVFEAEHVRLNRRLAIKVMARHLIREERAFTRFKREAEIIGLLQHPHVVHITDFDTTERGEPYIVMELLQGESLGVRLERERILPTLLAVRIACQAASGLAAVHAATIVHRDLKPQNIFLTKAMGDGPLVKLLDFGISKCADMGHGITRDNDILGTPDYMPPEQALGKAASVDGRGDQYALAVILYEMLAGRVPFLGDTVAQILDQVIHKEPAPIEKFAPHVPARVGKVLARALAKDPADRFTSILDFGNALAGAAGCSLPPPADGPSGATLQLTTDPTVAGERRRARAATPLTVDGPRAAHPEKSLVRTLAGGFSVNEVARALERAKRARDSGESEAAAAHAERALATAEALESDGASAKVNSESALIDAILEERIGPLDRVLSTALLPGRRASFHVSPEQAFLLSRIDGRLTVEEIIDLSPLPRQKTLRLLVGMLQSGLITAS
jgi:tRNA A-37 threonylcarbamoyl transferase component Bud32